MKKENSSNCIKHNSYTHSHPCRKWSQNTWTQYRKQINISVFCLNLFFFAFQLLFLPLLLFQLFLIFFFVHSRLMHERQNHVSSWATQKPNEKVLHFIRKNHRMFRIWLSLWVEHVKYAMNIWRKLEAHRQNHSTIPFLQISQPNNPDKWTKTHLYVFNAFGTEMVIFVVVAVVKNCIRITGKSHNSIQG